MHLSAHGLLLGEISSLGYRRNQGRHKANAVIHAQAIQARILPIPTEPIRPTPPCEIIENS